jgi:SAM-dependent methyltransferase
MNYVYERGLEGANLFARAVHLAFLEVRAAEAVRARKDLVKRELLTKLAQADAEGRTARVLSIAAGPGQELYELFSEGKVPGKLHLTLFDQDQGALTYAHRRLSLVAQAQLRGSVEIVYLRDSIKRLLVDPEIFADHGTFDAIVCAGFFDYLRIHSAVRTTRTFYRYLRPGGAAFIGNMVPENPSRWLMEYHLDWWLIYRSRDEMIAFAHEAAPDAKIEVLEERTGVNPFLAVERPH